VTAIVRHAPSSWVNLDGHWEKRLKSEYYEYEYFLKQGVGMRGNLFECRRSIAYQWQLHVVQLSAYHLEFGAFLRFRRRRVDMLSFD